MLRTAPTNLHPEQNYDDAIFLSQVSKTPKYHAVYDAASLLS